MNIPKRQGTYTLNIGQKTIKIDIHPESVRLSKMDLIGTSRTIGGYKYETKYDVKVFDSDNNLIDRESTFDQSEYASFISSHVAKENNVNVNPKDIMDKLYMKIQREFAYIYGCKFGGIVRNKMKFTYYMEVQDPQDIVNYFDSIGIVCKVAPKRKPIRAAMCWAASVYLPLDYNINENKTRNNMKRTIRLRESEFRQMIAESILKTLNIPSDKYNDFEMDRDEAEKLGKEICDSIEAGEYDNELENILQNRPWHVFKFGAQFPYYERIDDAAYERKCLIDKEYALSHGKDTDYPDRNSIFHPDYTEIAMKHRANPNKYDDHDTNYHMWRHKQNMINQRRRDNRWQKSSDSRPLHRKGSLNRAMDESVNRKINRIVSESIRRNLR